MSRAAIESYPGKQLNKKCFATNQLLWQLLLEFCAYFTIFIRVKLQLALIQ